MAAGAVPALRAASRSLARRNSSRESFPVPVQGYQNEAKEIINETVSPVAEAMLEGGRSEQSCRRERWRSAHRSVLCALNRGNGNKKADSDEIRTRAGNPSRIEHMA